MSDEQQAEHADQADQSGRADEHRADAGTDHTDAGTGGGDPIAGVRIDAQEAEDAAEPDDRAFEVDGPEASAGHA